MMERYLLTIRVTEEQRELISAMWTHNEWDLDVVTEEMETG
jgi:hypothetical protein